MKIKSVVLHNALHAGENVGHPIYYALVATFAHGPYAFAAGALAIISLLLLVIVEE